jgi:D-3-phosphoglycerate dehydrogenase
MSRVVITDCDHGSIDIELAVFRAAGHEVALERCRTEEETIAAVARADGLLAQYAPITESVMDAAPRLRVIGRYGVSLDTVDRPAAAARGIRVVNVPDYCVGEVADHAIALMLAVTRGIVGYDRAIHSGIWDFRATGGLQRGSTLRVGLIGLGRIGGATARRALALGYQVVASDPNPTPVDGVAMVGQDELLATSDVVSLHCWLDPSTRHLLDAAAMARMRRGAVLVNTSRGGLVDQSALVEALRSGHLSGAALDVLEREPIESDDPLLSMPNVILTPHAAFYSRESLIEMKQRVAEGIVAALADPAVRRT